MPEPRFHKGDKVQIKTNRNTCYWGVVHEEGTWWEDITPPGYTYLVRSTYMKCNKVGLPGNTLTKHYVKARECVNSTFVRRSAVNHCPSSWRNGWLLKNPRWSSRRRSQSRSRRIRAEKAVRARRRSSRRNFIIFSSYLIEYRDASG